MSVEKLRELIEEEKRINVATYREEIEDMLSHQFSIKRIYEILKESVLPKLSKRELEYYVAKIKPRKNVPAPVEKQITSSQITSSRSSQPKKSALESDVNLLELSMSNKGK